LVESSRVVTAASSAATAIRNRAPISPEALNLWPSFPGHGLLLQARKMVLERGGFQAGKQKGENPSLVISAINLARILPDVPRNQKSRGGFWLPHQPQLQQREEEEH